MNVALTMEVAIKLVSMMLVVTTVIVLMDTLWMKMDMNVQVNTCIYLV